MNIDDLTIGQAKELSNLFSNNSKVETKGHPFEMSKNYFIRTVTHAHTGRIKSISGQFLVLEDAAWIADTGRFYDALKNTDFSEIEPFSNDLILNMDSIIDATLIDGKLPSVQK